MTSAHPVQHFAGLGKKLLYSGISDGLASIFLLLAGLKFTYRLPSTLDIDVYDEASYLYRGVKLVEDGVPSAELSPLYSAWYYVLSLLQPDRVALFYLNYKAVTVLPPILVFFLLRRYGLSTLASVIVSGLFLISTANLPVTPKPTHFALIIILLSLIAATYAKRDTSAILLVCIGTLLCSYARPEFFLTYILILIVYIVVVVVRRREIRIWREILGLGAVLLVSALLLYVMGLPAFGGGGRSFIAFGQHFSLNWINWSGSDLNPWDDWGTITSQNFGDARSIGAAFLYNPQVFMQHVAFNVVEAPMLLLTLFLQHSPLVFPPTNPSFMILEGWVLLALVGLYVLYVFHRRRSATGRATGLGGNLRKRPVHLLLIGLYILTGIISVILIYPRPHYLLLPGVLVVIAVAAFLAAPNTTEAAQPNYKQALIIGFLVLAITPTLEGPPPFPETPGPNGRPNAATIAFIESLGIAKEVNLLTADEKYNYYLDDNFREVFQYSKSTDFDEFRQDENINMIVLSDRLLNDSRFKTDEDWRLFLDNYPSLGYEQVDIPNSNKKLIVKEDLF